MNFCMEKIMIKKIFLISIVCFLFLNISAAAEKVILLSNLYYFNLAENVIKNCDPSNTFFCYKRKTWLLTNALEKSDSYRNTNFRAHILYERGTAYMYLDNFEKAINDFNEAVKLINDEWWNIDKWNREHQSLILFSRGFAYKMLDQYDNAIKDFNDATVIEDEWNKDNLSQIIFYRGITYDKKGDIDNAFKDLTEVLDKIDDNWKHENLEMISSEWFYINIKKNPPPGPPPYRIVVPVPGEEF